MELFGKKLAEGMLGKRLVLMIRVEESDDTKVEVVGCLNEKDLCLRVLAEAIKIVLDFKKSPIIKLN